jgi:phosphatidylglycerol:prolipoprotein diacylglycerol transferase
MYPVLFELPYFGLPITSFGAMMVVGFLAAYWITARRMDELGLDVEQASNMLLWCMFGGVFGSKLYYAIDTTLLGTNPSFFEALFSRGGMTWYGGLLGGFVFASIGSRFHGVGIRLFFHCATVGAAVGQAFGRIGCFLVGDDYGRPTDAWWAFAFPEGAPPTLVPVHPTQLYEVAWLLPIAALLWRRRSASPFLFGEYLMATGVGRLFIEHWRVNERVALGLTEAQWIGVTMAAIGAASWIYYQSYPEPLPGSARAA